MTSSGYGGYFHPNADSAAIEAAADEAQVTAMALLLTGSSFAGDFFILERLFRSRVTDPTPHAFDSMTIVDSDPNKKAKMLELLKAIGSRDRPSAEVWRQYLGAIRAREAAQGDR